MNKNMNKKTYRTIDKNTSPLLTEMIKNRREEKTDENL
jgi:hypothetical protein